MMRGILTISTFAAILLFPWPIFTGLALSAAVAEPLLPLAAGIFADSLYYSSYDGAVPLFSLFGALATAIGFFVRSRISGVS